MSGCVFTYGGKEPNKPPFYVCCFERSRKADPASVLAVAAAAAFAGAAAAAVAGVAAAAVAGVAAAAFAGAAAPVAGVADAVIAERQQHAEYKGSRA